MPADLPLIGMTMYYVEAAWDARSWLSALVPANYFELAARAGGQPLLLPPVRAGDLTDAGARAEEVVGRLDGLVLIGGGDLDPSAYGEPPVPQTTLVDPVRDRWELALLEAALARRVPVLAICRGLQLLNVHHGGTLHQDLPTLGITAHSPGLARFADVVVTTVPGTRAAAVFGAEPTVRCSHHQSIDRLGVGLAVSAWSNGDRAPVIEAVELPGSPFVLGVQWHPEESRDVRPFRALVGAASHTPDPSGGRDCRSGPIT